MALVWYISEKEKKSFVSDPQMPKADVRASTTHRASVRSAKTKAADAYAEKTIENAIHLLSCGPPSQRDLLFFGVDVLKELCKTKCILVTSTGWRQDKPLKLDYVRALSKHVR
jgi:hypothetical protein